MLLTGYDAIQCNIFLKQLINLLLDECPDDDCISETDLIISVLNYL